MIPSPNRLSALLVAPALLLLVCACAEQVAKAPAPEPTPSGEAAPGLAGTTLELRAAESEGADAVVDLHFTRGDSAKAPRMMELRLRLHGLRYVSSEALSGVTTAGKELVVQDDEGVLRTVVYATGNLNRLDTGPLVRYRLVREASAGEARVEILSQRPVFAPPEADLGVTLGPALDVGGP